MTKNSFKLLGTMLAQTGGFRQFQLFSRIQCMIDLD